MFAHSSAGGGGFRNPPNRRGEVGEVAFPADVARIGGVPLDAVALDHVGGVECRAVVEGHTLREGGTSTQCRPRSTPSSRRVTGRWRCHRSRKRAATPGSARRPAGPRRRSRRRSTSRSVRRSGRTRTDPGPRSPSQTGSRCSAGWRGRPRPLPCRRGRAAIGDGHHRYVLGEKVVDLGVQLVAGVLISDRAGFGE